MKIVYSNQNMITVHINNKDNFTSFGIEKNPYN